MTPFIYGSQAKLLNRGSSLDISKDLDIICLDEDRQRLSDQFKDFRVDFSSPEFLNNGVISDLYVSRTFEGLNVCSSTGLAIFKRSHAWKKCRKTGYGPLMSYLSLKKHMSNEDYLIAAERQKLTIGFFKEQKVSLNKDNDVFFTEMVTRQIPHDDLHQLVVDFSDYDRPINELMRKNLNNPYCSEDLWNRFTYDDKLKAVWEEATVIAIERFPKFTPKRAYYNALCMICTTLCQGWFRDFAIDNFENVYDLFDSRLMTDVRKELNTL